MNGNFSPGEASGIVLQVPKGLNHHAEVVRPQRVGPGSVVRPLAPLLRQVGGQDVLKNWQQ